MSMPVFSNLIVEDEISILFRCQAGEAQVIRCLGGFKKLYLADHRRIGLTVFQFWRIKLSSIEHYPVASENNFFSTQGYPVAEWMIGCFGTTHTWRLQKQCSLENSHIVCEMDCKIHLSASLYSASAFQNCWAFFFFFLSLWFPIMHRTDHNNGLMFQKTISKMEIREDLLTVIVFPLHSVPSFANSPSCI